MIERPHDLDYLVHRTTSVTTAGLDKLASVAIYTIQVEEKFNMLTAELGHLQTQLTQERQKNERERGRLEWWIWHKAEETISVEDETEGDPCLCWLDDYDQGHEVPIINDDINAAIDKAMETQDDTP